MGTPRPPIRLERHAGTTDERDPPGHAQHRARTSPTHARLGRRGGPRSSRRSTSTATCSRRTRRAAAWRGSRSIPRVGAGRSHQGRPRPLRRGADRAPARSSRRGGGAAQRSAAARELHRPASSSITAGARGSARGWTRAALMRFHERHKFLLMARNQAAMRRLGRLLGEAGKGTAAGGSRRRLPRRADGDPPPPGHPARPHQRPPSPGGLRLRRPRRARTAPSSPPPSSATAWGWCPLIVPLTLLRHHVRRQEIAYLQDQVYLEPHPHELMLLNHV